MAPARISCFARKKSSRHPCARFGNRLAPVTAIVGDEEALPAVDVALLDGERAGGPDKEGTGQGEQAGIKAADRRCTGDQPVGVSRGGLEVGARSLGNVVALQRDQVDGESARRGDAIQIERPLADRQQSPTRGSRPTSTS